MSEKPFDFLDQFAEPPTDRQRIESLENQLENLRNIIREMVEMTQGFSLPIIGLEIVQKLSEWADPDESDER